MVFLVERPTPTIRQVPSGAPHHSGSTTIGTTCPAAGGASVASSVLTRTRTNIAPPVALMIVLVLLLALFAWIRFRRHHREATEPAEDSEMDPEAEFDYEPQPR